MHRTCLPDFRGRLQFRHARHQLAWINYHQFQRKLVNFLMQWLLKMAPGPESSMHVVSHTGTDYEAYYIHAKSYCAYCGCQDKQLEANRPQCSRCLCFEFTDRPETVQNWFDEDLEYDARTKGWRPSSSGDVLPNQTKLDEAWNTTTWRDDEVHRLDSDSMPENTISSHSSRALLDGQRRMKAGHG